MPIGYWLTFHAGVGVRGMWMGLIAGLTVAAVMLFARFAARTRHGAVGLALRRARP
jgi:MATE family multidrug resistance protein